MSKPGVRLGGPQAERDTPVSQSKAADGKQIISKAQEKCNYTTGLALRFIGPFPPHFTSSTFIPDNGRQLVIVPS